MSKFVVANVTGGHFNQGRIISEFPSEEAAVVSLLKEAVVATTRFAVADGQDQILEYTWKLLGTAASITLEGTAGDQIQAEITIQISSESIGYESGFSCSIIAVNRFEQSLTISLVTSKWLEDTFDAQRDESRDIAWTMACWMVGLWYQPTGSEVGIGEEDEDENSGELWQVSINPPVEHAELMEKICYALGSPSTEEMEAVDEQGYAWMITLPEQLQERMEEDESLEEVVTVDGITYTITCEMP